MELNYGKLKGRIVEKFGTQKNFVKAINRSERTVSLKLSGKIDFTQGDILIWCNALDIELIEIPSYFFVSNVHS